MSSTIKTIILFHLFFTCVLLQASAQSPKLERLPLWADTVLVDYNSTDLDKEAEDGYVDLVFDKQTSLPQQAVYVKKVIRIISEAGIQNASEVSVDYDPSYQQLFFHSVRIIRGGQLINKLVASKFKTVHQEKELHRFIYNGTVTSMLILEDVQKGDVIEYSYTIKGFNPVFANKYADSYSLAFGVPIYRLHYKLIVPPGRSVDIKNSRTTIEPRITTLGDATSYDWNNTNTGAIHEQDRVPSWFDAYPAVMVSEYKSWKEVSQWALGLFPFSPALSPRLQNQVEKWKRENQTDESRLAASLHFVQDDIRYMGIEMGKNSYKPHSPDQVLAQRFGDCKDKSYLLCTLLQAMGIEARPVLINTYYKKTIGDRLPSPTLFDHCTVCVKLDGQQYWFDPTIMYQRGSVKEVSYPDYQMGLVVNTGTSDLSSIPNKERGSVHVKESFKTIDMTGPVPFTVTTTYSGTYADDIRYNFKSSSLHEMEQGYRDFYAAYFSKINMDSLVYEDDEASGKFITREYYTIRDMWSTDRGVSKVSFEPYVINSIINRPKQKERTMPFSLNYPARYHEEIEVVLPDGGWNVRQSSHHFETPGFRFNYSYSSKADDVALLSYDYENTKDFIAPSEASDYFGKLDDADKAVTYEFSSDWNKTVPVRTQVSGGGRFNLLYVLLAVCTLITYLIRRSKKAY